MRKMLKSRKRVHTHSHHQPELMSMRKSAAAASIASRIEDMTVDFTRSGFHQVAQPESTTHGIEAIAVLDAKVLVQAEGNPKDYLRVCQPQHKKHTSCHKGPRKRTDPAVINGDDAPEEEKNYKDTI